MVGTAHDFEPLLKGQETQFSALPALRAASLEGQACKAATLTRALTTISTNLQFRYVHPEIGIVAYGDAARLKGIDGAAGFLAPWIDAQVIGDDDAPLGADRAGRLRFRLRPDALWIGSRPAQPEQDDWIYPQQRARIAGNNLLLLEDGHAAV